MTKFLCVLVLIVVGLMPVGLFGNDVALSVPSPASGKVRITATGLPSTLLRLRINTIKVVDCPSSPCLYEWDTTIEPNGPHTITLQVFGGASNWESRATVNVHVNNLPPPPVTLSLLASGTGSGVLSGAGTYVQGMVVTIMALPTSTSVFAGWGGAGCPTGTVSPATVTLWNDLTCIGTFTLLPPPSSGGPDPALLAQATTSQVPLTAAYQALNVPGLAAGAFYRDPLTQVKIYKITSASFPTTGQSRYSHDYGEGGDEVSLPYKPDGTRALHVVGGGHWLVDFTPGQGVSNARRLTGNMVPHMDLAMTFSSRASTPWYLYVSTGSVIRRFDIRTMTEAPGDGWPVTGETSAVWLHQSHDDDFFTWMRGSVGSTIVGYEPTTTTKKTYTNSGLNEPRIDRGGRYVAISMNNNGFRLWDFLTNIIVAQTPGDPGVPFAHNSSLMRRWYVSNWNTGPNRFMVFGLDIPGITKTTGADGTLGFSTYGNGNWNQPTVSLDAQWSLHSTYGAVRPSDSGRLAPGAMVYINALGERRTLAHPYNASGDYVYYAFPKSSPDGRYVLFTSDMNASGRSDQFLVEVPVR